MAVVSSRYARAFADVVFERRLDALVVLQELQSVEAMVNSSEQLRRVWDAPSIPASQKRALLDQIAEKSNLSKPLRNLVALLIDHHRIHQLGEISRLFEAEVNERLGLAEAQVVSAREMSEQQRKELETQITRFTGKRVRAKYETDSKLLGGAIVRMGSTIYDGSVRGQLQKIKEQLSS